MICEYLPESGARRSIWGVEYGLHSAGSHQAHSKNAGFFLVYGCKALAFCKRPCYSDSKVASVFQMSQGCVCACLPMQLTPLTGTMTGFPAELLEML